MKSKKKFAMMMMDAQYDTKRDYAVFETEEVETHMITVNSPEQAVQMAKELAEQGFGAILSFRLTISIFAKKMKAAICRYSITTSVCWRRITLKQN